MRRRRGGGRGGGAPPPPPRPAGLPGEARAPPAPPPAAGRPRHAGADGLPAHPLPTRELESLPAALRRRVLRGWLRAAGVPDVQAVHLRAVEALVTRWRGQGRVDLPGGAGALRTSGRLVLSPPETRGPRPEDAPPTREESRP